MSKRGKRDDEMVFEPIVPYLRPPSEACLRYMASHGYDPQMPVFRAVVSPEFMAKTKAQRSDVANTLQLLVGPFGVVAPSRQTAFRVAELQVGSIVLDVEAEYDWDGKAGTR